MQKKGKGYKMKKGKVIWIIVGLLVVMFGCSALLEPSDSDTGAKEEAVETDSSINDADNEIEEETSIPETSKGEEEMKKESVEETAGADVDMFSQIGKIFTSEDKTLSMEVMDIQYKVNTFELASGQPFSSCMLFVIMDITNNGDSDLSFTQDDARLYIDDYEVNKGSGVDILSDMGYSSDANNVDYPLSTTANAGGRKGQIMFIAQIDEDTIAKNSEIELDISGAVISFDAKTLLDACDADKASKEPYAGTELEGMQVGEIKDGTYVSAECDTVITVEGGSVTVQNSNGADFENGIVQELGDHYVVLDTKSEAAWAFTFMGESGLVVDKDVNFPNDISSDLCGWYDRIN